MKTTVNVNLGGEVFILNDDAFEVLKTYTDEKGEYVEGRLATFFQNRLRKNGRKIVDIDDVNAAIESIEHPVQTECENTNGRKIAKGRKLYRDTVNGVIGGVSSGIAAYFGWDEAVIRILWVLLFFLGNGVVAIAYILFWMFVPEAATPKQRLEMYGKEITEENLREESNVAKEGSTGGGCLGMLGKIFVIMSAVFIVFPILAIIFFVLLMSGVVGVGMVVPTVGGFAAVLIAIAATLVFICPIAALVYLGLNLKSSSNADGTEKKKNTWWVYVALLVVWLVSVGYLCAQHRIIENSLPQIDQYIDDLDDRIDDAFDDDYIAPIDTTFTGF